MIYLQNVGISHGDSTNLLADFYHYYYDHHFTNSNLYLYLYSEGIILISVDIEKHKRCM